MNHNIRSFARQIGAVLLLSPLLSAAAPEVSVFKTRTCGCCAKWVDHMRANGFQVNVTDVPDTTAYRRKLGVPEGLDSCHTAVVGGYTLEGHVPSADVQRLLKTRPRKAKGLAVPGMPIGSPGMEQGERRQAYTVVMFDAAGKSSQFQQYPAK
ncbi:MAG TPA: DUF411 domain-containing protein [Bryobacteraceae bacterium]|nr:DUF411 domain-containing protein [Bryobacteraceae bacterium]